MDSTMKRIDGKLLIWMLVLGVIGALDMLALSVSITGFQQSFGSFGIEIPKLTTLAISFPSLYLLLFALVFGLNLLYLIMKERYLGYSAIGVSLVAICLSIIVRYALYLPISGMGNLL